jgi:DNA-binding IscR family transcriptional regulator
MYLTPQADYTMRLLIHLAVQPDEPATIHGYNEALRAYLSVLDKYSLADVVRRKTVLVQLLGLNVA